MKFKLRHQIILSCLLAVSLLGVANGHAHADNIGNIDANHYYTQAAQIKVVNGNYLYKSTNFVANQRIAYISRGTVLNVSQIVSGGRSRGVFKVNYHGKEYYFSAYKYYSTVTSTRYMPKDQQVVNNNLYHTKARQIKVINGNYLYKSTNFIPSQSLNYIAPGTILNVNQVVSVNNTRTVFKVNYHGKEYYFSGYKYYSVVTISDYVPQPQPKPAPSSKERVLTAWRNINYNGAAKVSIALYNNKTGESVMYTPRGSATGFYNASIVKVSIMGQYLLTHNLPMNSTAAYMARLMITQSDNNAANYLYHAGGWANGLQSFYNWMGMYNSTANRQNLWGLNTTSASDQLKLLNGIYYQRTMLPANKLNIITNLMGQVSSAQRWGVGNVYGASVQVKNGWLPLGNGSSNAVINSLGHIKNNKVDYTLAILTNGNKTQGSGINLVNRIGATTFNTLNK